MPTLVISSTEGGVSTKSPTSLLDNQVAQALNVEWIKSKCGERRAGSDAIDFSSSDLDGADRIAWMYRHLPTNDYADAQLWALAVFDIGGTPSVVLGYKDTTWHTVSVSDAFTVDGVSEYRVSGQTLHGKLFIAYNSAVDRMHVWDGTSLRRTGLAEPAAPTAADSGVPGVAITGTRYYRVRYTVQSGGTTLRRSEPSDVRTHAPSGTNTTIVVTKPASISESETHWELEASTDNINFYVLATTVVGTTTVNDTTVYATGYTAGVLSEDLGDYSLIPSVKYLTADNDRLIAGGSWEQTALASRVMYTPVFAAPGVGNDERLESDTDPFRDLDNFEGGELTGLSENVNGYIYATKYSHVYQGIRTGDRADAYEFIPITKYRGAIPGSIVTGVDNSGLPTLFALDPDVGPIRIGSEGGGVESCGSDLVELWNDLRSDAITNGGAQTCVYVPEKKQVHFCVAGSVYCLVLHTQHMRMTDEGFRGGWAVWLSGSSTHSACLFSTNVDAGVDRNRTLRLFRGATTGLTAAVMLRTDTGNDDNGTAYSAAIATRQYHVGNFVDDVEAKGCVLFGVAKTNAVVNIQVNGIKPSIGLLSDTQVDVSFTPDSGGAEGAIYHYDNGFAIRPVDSQGLAEVRTLGARITDGTGNATQWALESIAIPWTYGQKHEGH